MNPRSEGDGRLARLPRLSNKAFLRITQISLVLCVLNVISGATVRLTDSGLGCADWPSCSKSQFTPPLSFHPIMEFGNRMVVGLLVAAVAITFIAALLRSTRRTDLTYLSGGLVIGVIGEALVGAVVVYSKLNPYVVMLHFMLGMALVTVAFFLTLRAGRAAVVGTSKVTPQIRRVTWLMIVILGIALLAGTATTGAGPHAGSTDAKRIPIPLADMARTHSSIVIVLGALLLFELWLLHREATPMSVVKRGHLLLAVMVAQGLVGYTQFFTHEPSLLVGIHVCGAISVLLTMFWFYDGLSHHPADVDTPLVAPGSPVVQSSAPTLVEAAK